MIPVADVAAGLREATQQLSAVSDTARLDAELLMAEALGVSRSDLLLRHHKAEVPARFADFLARRMRHEPVAYILGRQEFYGREFLVTDDVLIPRSDSETVVEAALEAAPDFNRALDCGVGSGALLLTLLAEREGSEGVGIDRSLGALSVAASNAAHLGLADRCRMLKRDWHEDGWREELGTFDLVIANPPYVETDAELAHSVRDFEPAGALFSGPDGLDDYRALVPQLRSLLSESGIVVLEIGASQGESVAGIARESDFDAELRRDLAGRARALILR